MVQSANVKSIDALQAMVAALECFQSDAAAAIDELDMEIRRAVLYISEDCRQYWKQEFRRATEKVVEAKLALEHAEMFRRGDGQRSSCHEERKALECAKRRLALAEFKLQAIKHWTIVVERAVNDYRPVRSQFGGWLESDLPKAVAVLSRMIAALETYVRMGTPNAQQPIAHAIQSSTEAQTAENRPQIEPETKP
jgi:hypothetical protein